MGADVTICPTIIYKKEASGKRFWIKNYGVKGKPSNPYPLIFTPVFSTFSALPTFSAFT
jgi:hypothetical protein